MRVKPYYLHHGDLAPGTAHFRTTIAEGQALMRAACAARLSGLALPTYVLDIPGAHGKVPIGPDYCARHGAGTYSVRGSRESTHTSTRTAAPPRRTCVDSVDLNFSGLDSPANLKATHADHFCTARSQLFNWTPRRTVRSARKCINNERLQAPILVEGNTMNEQVKSRQLSIGACPHDCPDTCAMDLRGRDGQARQRQGQQRTPDHARHPVREAQGLPRPPRQSRPPDVSAAPRRPQGLGPNGGNTFERITWDEAISEIGRRWREIIAEYGSQAIMPQSYLGNMGLVQGINSGDPFFNRLGSTVNEKTYCTSGSSTAWLLTHGPTGGVDPESFVHCKYIVIWACNSISTNLHHWPFVLEAQKRGAKVVVIDSYKSRTAKAGDWHICPKPGTDGALALGIINSMVEQGLVDQDYVDKYTHRTGPSSKHAPPNSRSSTSRKSPA